MTHKIPKSIEHEIAYHLKNNDPESAKAVYDQWVMKNGEHNTEKSELNSTSDQSDHADLF